MPKDIDLEAPCRRSPTPPNRLFQYGGRKAYKDRGDDFRQNAPRTRQRVERSGEIWNRQNTTKTFAVPVCGDSDFGAFGSVHGAAARIASYGAGRLGHRLATAAISTMSTAALIATAPSVMPNPAILTISLSVDAGLPLRKPLCGLRKRPGRVNRPNYRFPVI